GGQSVGNVSRHQLAIPKLPDYTNSQQLDSPTSQLNRNGDVDVSEIVFTCITSNAFAAPHRRRHRASWFKLVYEVRCPGDLLPDNRAWRADYRHREIALRNRRRNRRCAVAA